MRIGEISTAKAICCTREATVLEAAQLMRQHHVGDLIVVDDLSGEQVPVGIVTDRDIVVSITAEGLDTKSLEVGDIMSAELLAASEDADVHDTIERMRYKGVRRIPVTNSAGSLVGIVSVDDMMEFLAEEMTILSRISSRQQSIEKQTKK